jgi:hypothetical protein
MPVANYENFKQLMTAVCSIDAGKFCRDSDIMFVEDVCTNFAVLPDFIKVGTSIESACKVNWTRVCTDPALKEKICPGGQIIPSLCTLYPSRCDGSAAAAVDPCLMNWKECLTKPAFNLCNAAPELCKVELPPVNPTYPSFDSMQADLCSKNAQDFCNADKTLSIEQICKNISKLDATVATGTSLAKACTEIDLSNLCSSTSPLSKESWACQNGAINYNYCAKFEEKCFPGTSTYDKCALDWRKCLSDPNWSFCKSFPEICKSLS